MSYFEPSQPKWLMLNIHDVKNALARDDIMPVLTHIPNRSKSKVSKRVKIAARLSSVYNREVLGFDGAYVVII